MPLTNRPSRCQQKTYLNQNFCLLLFEDTFTVHHFSKIKSKKKLQYSRNQVFSYYFGLMIEWSGSGYILLISGSGSGSMRPKNVRIRRIRIHNTCENNPGRGFSGCAGSAEGEPWCRGEICCRAGGAGAGAAGLQGPAGGQGRARHTAAPPHPDTGQAQVPSHSEGTVPFVMYLYPSCCVSFDFLS